MNFSTDRDLLAREPKLFTDLAVLAPPRVSVNDASVTGTTLTSASADFIAAGVEPGSVVLLAGTPHEVTARIDAQTLTVSLLRKSLSHAAIPGTQGTNLALVARSFEAHAALVKGALLELVRTDEDAIVSLTQMAYLETLGTLERLYASAGALLDGGWRDTLLLKADGYRRDFHAALRRASVLLDEDNDGFADRRVDLANVRLIRN